MQPRRLNVYYSAGRQSAAAAIHNLTRKINYTIYLQYDLEIFVTRLKLVKCNEAPSSSTHND